MGVCWHFAQLLFSGVLANCLANLRFDYLFAVGGGINRGGSIVGGVGVASSERNTVFLKLVLLGLPSEVALWVLDVGFLVLSL